MNLQGIVDPVYQVGKGNNHGQLDDFILGIIPSNIIEHVIIDSGGPAGNDVRQANGDFLFCIEDITALVKF